MNLLIMGPAGSGKGTMSERILTVYDIPHISTGDMLRKAIDDKLEYGLKANEYMSQGKLVPDEIINQIIEARLQEKDLDNGFLADGYPRTLQQALEFDMILGRLGKKIDAVLNLVVDFDELAKRVTGRRLCPNCKAIYHIENHPSKVEGICDVCGSKLIQRNDDTIESLKTRLDEHHRNTEPVLEHYRQKGLVYDIDASRDIDTVFKNVEEVLKAL